MIKIDSKIPEGPVAEKWTNYKAHQKLVNPANKRRLDIIVVGTGLAGASAAASLGEMGFRVFNFCIQDSPRRAHSIAAQGGINAAKNYQNDGDSVYRLFYDTVKVVTIVHVKPTFTVWPKCPTLSSTNAWHKVFLSHANTAVHWTTVLLVVHRYHVRSTLKARPVSSCCWVLTPH